MNTGQSEPVAVTGFGSCKCVFSVRSLRSRMMLTGGATPEALIGERSVKHEPGLRVRVRIRV